MGISDRMKKLLAFLLFSFIIYLPMVIDAHIPVFGVELEGTLRDRDQYIVPGSPVKLHLLWSETEPTRGVYVWPTELGSDIARLKDHYVLLSIKGTPIWARSNSSDLVCDPPNAVYLEDFARFIRAVVIKYPVWGVEIWNEPDVAHHSEELAPYFGCNWSGQFYAEMLTHVYPIAHAARPDIKIVAGAMHNPLWWQYVENIHDYYDMVSFHGYPNYSFPLDGADLLRQWTDKPIVLSETSLLMDGTPTPVFEQAQAEYLTYVATHAKEHGVILVIWYTLADNGWRNSDLVINGIRKPAWYAYQSLFR